jgi:esterase/lipase
MIDRQDLVISEATYQRCVRGFSFLHKRLGLNIALHDPAGAVESGQIFLFNHFARFETIIPQYLIFKETGAYCRTLASQEFFASSGGFAKFLTEIGGVPNDVEGLLPFLAAEILAGRKVVVFPEGGMVKDRRVVDEAGEFRIFSPTAKRHRKHHKGAAAVALILEIFKKRIISLAAKGETARLGRWREAVGLDSIDALVAAAERPTLVVPGNITFYPIRAEENLIQSSVQLFFRGLREHFKEELLIEGSLLLKGTDMDIRLGRPVAPDLTWHWWDRLLLGWGFAHVESLDHLFDVNNAPDKWISHLASMLVNRRMRSLRDHSMRAMYQNTTVNLHHLASHLILHLAAKGYHKIRRERFYEALYLAVKFVQGEQAVHLNTSLTDPQAYEGVLSGESEDLQTFLLAATKSDLIREEAGCYHLDPKLTEGYGFHEVRVKNPIQVYANEVAPLTGVRQAVERAWEQASSISGDAFARFIFDDEMKSYRQSKRAFSTDRHRDINDQQTAVRSGEPYLLQPQEPKSLSVVLAHGFLASPAELRPFGEKLAELGYPVVGVRLSGHGTSPWDLRERRWEDWLASFDRGYRIASGLAERVCVVGFSAGGSLALLSASRRPVGLAGVAAVSPPMKLRNKNFIFVPVLHGANKVTEWVSSLEGVMTFRPNDPEHPDINYRHIPVRALFELRRLIDKVDANLAQVTCPLAVLQSTDDHVVDPKSAQLVLDKVSSEEKTLHWVDSDRHGILNEDIGGTWEKILAFITACEADLTLEDTIQALPAPVGEPQVGDLSGPRLEPVR